MNASNYLKSTQEKIFFYEKQDLIYSDVKYKGGFYTDKEVIHMLTKCYRREWDDSVFTGNGMVGTTVYKLSPQKTMWELGRNDVTAHNFLQGVDWALPRVPIGNIILEPKDKITKETMRLHVYDAHLSGKIETTNGALTYTSFVPHGSDGIYISIETSGNFEYSLSVQPRHGISDRIYFSGKKVDLSLLPPMPYIQSDGDIIYSTQEFIAQDGEDITPEGACVLAWQCKATSNGKDFYISVQNENDKQIATEKAISDTRSFLSGKDEIINSHKEWWHNYYSKSFLCTDDEKWNKFYTLQMYKLACSIRENGVVLDSQGPFMTTTTWPTTVWNLNVQLSYSPVFTSNHTELANSLIRILKQNKQVLIENAKPMGISDGMYLSRATSTTNLHALWPDTYELGNILWALFTVDRKQRIHESEELVREILHPYLKMSINACATLFDTDDSGTIHIKDTSSPEYPSVDGANWHPIYDCTYTVSLLHWALDRVIELDEQYKINDDMLTQWKHIKANLVSEHVDEYGYKIGRDVSFTKSHRHFSHLMRIFPLCTMDFNDEAQCKLAEKSITHWLSLEKRLQGYTFTGAASMAACLKDGDKALEYLNGLDEFTSSNTMYTEFAPVIETPLSAAEAIHTMLLQSHGGIIQPLCAVPSSWQNVYCENLLADGGFEVSFKREHSKTQFIKIKSIYGNNLCVKLPDDMADSAVCTADIKIISDKGNTVQVMLKKGETAVFTQK